MQKEKYKNWLGLLLIIVFMAGCGGGGGGGGGGGTASDTTVPTVTAASPANSATGVAVNSTVRATFSEDMDAQSLKTSFTVTGMTGTVSYETATKTAVYTPSSDFAANTTYTATISTGAKDLAGNPLAQPMSWSFTTGNQKDTTAPSVTSTTPVDKAIGVSINGAITATFSEDMDGQSVIASFTLGGVTGSVTYDAANRIAVFTPSGNLAANTTYTATITTSAKDLAGNALAQQKAWSFSTGATRDTTAPQVVFTIPFDKETGVPINRAIAVTFTEDMDATSLKQSFGLGGVAGDVTYDPQTKTAVFTPSGNLTIGATYTATITTGAKDLAGNALATPYTWSFTTAAAPNVSPPEISLTIPADKATGVPINSWITATFSKYVAPMTITTQTFTLSGPSGAVDGIVAYDPATRIATFKPSSNLAASTTYTATFTTEVKDLDGNALAAPYSWSFTTGTEKDLTPPVVLSLTPADGATGVSTSASISITFNEPVMPFPLGLIDGKPVAVVFTNNNMTATMTPIGGLKPNTAYSTSFKSSDLAGNPVEVTWKFSTQ